MQQGPTQGKRLSAICVVMSLASLAIAGCGTPCEPSADVQLELGGDGAALSGIVTLVVAVTVGQGPRQEFRVDLTTPRVTGRTLLLSPKSPPAGDSYPLSVEIDALGAGASRLAAGAVSAVVGVHACNQLSLRLDPIVAGGDMARHEDLSGQDLATVDPGIDLGADGGSLDLAPDLLPCTATTPDEDGDGRGDACDVCAADPDATITDTDGDGVPNACDPAPATAGNQRRLFEGFNATPAGWTGTFTVAAGVATVDGTKNQPWASAANVALPAGVRLQTYETARDFKIAQAPDYSEVRLYAWTAVGTTGYACVLQYSSMNQYTLYAREGAVAGDPNLGGGGAGSLAILGPLDFPLNQQKRLRLTLHGMTLVCEVATPDGQYVTTATRTLATAPVAPLYAGVGTLPAIADFSSVFAVSYP